jgi:hypothetical protein
VTAVRAGCRRVDGCRSPVAGVRHRSEHGRERGREVKVPSLPLTARTTSSSPSHEPG